MTNNKINRKNNLDSNISNIINNIDSREGIAAVAGQLLNCLMSKERDIFLQNQIDDNKANGFY